MFACPRRLPNLSQIISPLRELFKIEVHRYWTEVHSKAFNDIKKIISSEQVIVAFEPNSPIGPTDPV